MIDKQIFIDFMDYQLMSKTEILEHDYGFYGVTWTKGQDIQDWCYGDVVISSNVMRDVVDSHELIGMGDYDDKLFRMFVLYRLLCEIEKMMVLVDEYEFSYGVKGTEEYLSDNIGGWLYVDR